MLVIPLKPVSTLVTCVDIAAPDRHAVEVRNAVAVAR